LRAIGGVDVPGSGQWGLVSDFLLGTFVFDRGADSLSGAPCIEVGILNLSPIPEPSAGWLMLGGLALLARWRRR
jgi:MYXO-CTERM domain-containing protein